VGVMYLKLVGLSHHIIYHLKQIYFRGYLYQRKYHADKFMLNSLKSRRLESVERNAGTGLTAITVSVNYTKVLSHVLEKNKSLFSEWIIVTDSNDLATIKLLKKYPDIKLIFFDFKKNGNKFNKGGAIREAQKLAYRISPDNWYLIIDSDIIIRSPTVFTSMEDLDQSAIYVCNDRRDYSRFSDLIRASNYKLYLTSMRAGYFQLYRKKELYIDWPDASYCDMVFGNNFSSLKNLTGIACDHLGEEGNHDGLRGPNFDFDV
jgi:hypothetical protein